MSDAPLLLCIEASTAVCSVALFRGSQLLGLQEYTSPQLHARLVTPTIVQLLANLDLKPAHLQAIAVGGGPGSYTGLRIATATAKGLCTALNIPLISVPTLQLLAASATEAAAALGAHIIPMLDARRMEVYAARYDHLLQQLQAPEAIILQPDTFDHLLATGSLLFVGDGVPKYRAVLETKAQAHSLPLGCSAAHMGALAWQRYQQQQFEHLVSYEPFYLKPVHIGRADAHNPWQATQDSSH